MSRSVEIIKERLPIADVIAGYVELVRAGANLKARCPFHNEKTPSFHISPSRNTYYCFGCGAKGDIFSFVEQFEGLDFPGALKVLAERAGVTLVPENKKVRDARERLFAVLETAAAFYEGEFAKSPSAQAYVAERGIVPETIHDFRIGFAPDTWRSVSPFLLAKGFTERELLDAGLIKKTDRGFYDRFRGRIIFPLADSSGRMIAFSGRILPGLPAAGQGGDRGSEKDDADTVAKYLNSPETPIFQKSSVLYGFDKAKFHIRQAGAALVVEGQMDLVLAHQAGFKQTVALSGTALSDNHVRLLKRLAPKVVLSLDADTAGIRAIGRSAHAALGEGMEVHVVALPDGRDPADIVKEDPGVFAKLVADAKHVVDFHLDVLASRGLDERSYRLEVARTVLPFIIRLENHVLRAHFVSIVARRIRLQEEHVWDELKRLGKRGAADQRPPASAVSNPTAGLSSRRRSLERVLRGIIVWQGAVAESPLVPHIRSRLTSIVGPEDAEAFFSADRESAGDALSFEVEQLYGAGDVLKTVDEILDSLEVEVLREAYSEAVRILTLAEAEGGGAGRDEALKKCHELSRRLALMQNGAK